MVQGTVRTTVVNTLKLDPVKFPDYATAYANLKTGQIDAWVAPSQQAEGAVKPGDGVRSPRIRSASTTSLAWAVGKPAETGGCAQLGLDAIIADGTYAKLYTDWVPRTACGLDPRQQGSRETRPARHRRHRPRQRRRQEDDTGTRRAPRAVERHLLQLGPLQRNRSRTCSRPACPTLLLLALVSGVLGTLLGLLLAVAGISRSRWLRWPARIYTDIFRGLPAVVVILIVGLGIGPVVSDVSATIHYWLGAVALALLAAAYIGESSLRYPERRGRAAGGLACDRLLLRTSMRLVVIPQGVRRVLPALMNQFISLIRTARWCISWVCWPASANCSPSAATSTRRRATCRRWSPRVWCICC